MLDTRFFIEHFFSSDPVTNAKTRKRLHSLREGRKGILPSIVLAEIVNLVCQRRGRREAEQRYQSMIASGLQIVEVRPEIAREAGLLKCKHRDVPFGDCIVASSAIKLEAKIVSDDPHFGSIKGLKQSWL